MRVLVGTAEIAGMMSFISGALKSSGHEVTTCTDNNDSGFYDFGYDISLSAKTFSKISSNRLVRKAQHIANHAASSRRRKEVFENEKDKHDVYVFMWNGFFPSGIDDYAYLKSRGKKIITLFLGSDIRHISAFTQEYHLDTSSWEQWFHSTDLNQQLFRLRKAELFSDAIFSLPDQSGLAITPYHKLYIPFDVDRAQFNVPARVRPKIVHIPSRSGIKGTACILAALEELKNEGVEFDFEYISGVSNKTVLEKLYDADILVDEIYLHGPGTLSLEGIASGCAVATKTIANEVYDGVVCNIGIDNIKERLKKLITDVHHRTRMAHHAIEQIKYLNDPVRIAQDVLAKGTSTHAPKEYDYYPRFFSDSYVLPNSTRLNRRNLRLTQNVIEKYHLAETLDLNRMKEKGLL